LSIIKRTLHIFIDALKKSTVLPYKKSNFIFDNDPSVHSRIKSPLFLLQKPLTKINETIVSPVFVFYSLQTMSKNHLSVNRKALRE
jgi:hypothetical protein